MPADIDIGMEFNLSKTMVNGLSGLEQNFKLLSLKWDFWSPVDVYPKLRAQIRSGECLLSRMPSSA